MTGMFDEQFGKAEPMPGQPIPIKAALGEPVQFPVDKLSPRLRAAIEAIRDKAQVPDAIAAQAVLGAIGLAAQCRLNVVLPTNEVMPVSLFLFSVASSGDRKSTADRLALAPVYRREAAMRQQYQRDQLAHNIDAAAYKAAVAAATRKGGADRVEINRLVNECGQPPLPPALPMLLVDEGTIEAIVKLLGDAQPSLGLFSDEGANMLGGYSMGEERKTATTAQLSQMWDGKPIKRVRAAEVVQFLPGRRLSVHLMVQPGVALKLFGDKATRDQGMMSRMLCAFPKTRKGERFWQDTSQETEDALHQYWARLEKMLEEPMDFVDPMTRELKLTDVPLTAEARALWIKFNDHLEKQVGPGGALEGVSDLASKLPQHAARIAAVIAYFEKHNAIFHGENAGIGPGALSVGIEISQYYLGEAQRLFSAGSVDDDNERAALLIDFIQKTGERVVGKRWLAQRAPKEVRSAQRLTRAIAILEDHGHLYPINDGAMMKTPVRNKVTGELEDKDVFYKDAWTVIIAEDDA